MGCNEIQSWTFVGLVGAFLDLSIAFLLLYASTLAYIVSKYLGLFGLCLPCPCNGLFGDASSGKCWQRVLVDCPTEKISSVQLSTKSRFPFDSIWDKNLNPLSDVNVKNHEHEFSGLDDETSYSSFQGRRSERSNGSGVMCARDIVEEKFDVKGKGIRNQKMRHALRRRRKGALGDGILFSSSISSFDNFLSDALPLPQSPSSVTKTVNESNGGTIIPDTFGGDAMHYGRDSLMDVNLLEREPPGFGSNGSTKEKKAMEKDGSCADDLHFNAQGELSTSNDEMHTTRVLENALEEEQTARSALYLELEKERSAAASAADEAMAMILRLQEEKASIEMEARQYQRMIEEKSAYDLEEMNILKEILLRREREKHFLEKEVETYRQMIFGSEQLDFYAQDIGTSHGKEASSLQYSGEEPELMLQEINESISDAEKVENANKISEYEATSIESQDILAFGKELPVPEDGVDLSKHGCIPGDPSITKYHQCLSSVNREINEKYEEMEPISWEKSQFSQESKEKSIDLHAESNLPMAGGYTLNDKTIAAVGELQQQSDDSEKYVKYLSMIPCTHDSNVIDDKLNMSNEVGGNGSEKISDNFALDIPKSCDSPVMSKPQTGQYISRSCSEITSALPPRGFLQSKPLLSDIRRNSMSAVDYERFKIDSEVGWLRERLRIIQEGREKLNISMEHREKENTQLQLLENIVNQLREIRQLTESGNAIHQVSLPLPSCKIMSKKRRLRSVSLEVHRST